ncbi:hypothetical protein HRH25_12445 [Flavisolibacter sp. BT320]|nr:hypothetical protein [Flavisolibacter longurius]
MATAPLIAYKMRSLIVIPFLVILSSSSGQTNKDTKAPLSRSGIPSTLNTNPSNAPEGIVYFSADNGLTWENKSAGLPSKISIAPGGIAVSNGRLALASKDSGLYFFDFGKGSWVKTPTDRQVIESNLGALTFYKDRIYIGTQYGGVFNSSDGGKSWAKLNTGLGNLTIRKLTEIDGKLYAATNAGLYAYNNLLDRWSLEYGSPTLQVNGITVFAGNLYIATNQGAFTTPIGRRDWQNIFVGGALHNISADDKALYAMVYNELFLSLDKGRSWKSIQKGLPAQLYTFNVIKNGNAVFAGQWDGVYRKGNDDEVWKHSSRGLPHQFAITNMQVYNGSIVVSGSERKLRAGITTDK